MEVSWLGPYNITVSAIYIFLIGLPAAVSQLTVPDEYRNIYRKRLGDKYFKPLIIGGLSVLIYYLTLGNIYLLVFTSNLSVVLPTIWKLLSTFFLIGLASGAVISFLNFLGYFENIGFNKKPRVVLDILNQIRVQYKGDRENCLHDLRYLSSTISRQEDCNEFITTLFEILNFELSGDHEDKLDNVRNLLELLEELLMNSSACSKNCVKDILYLLNTDLIINSINEGINKDNLINVYLEIGKNALRNNHFVLFKLLLDQLTKDLNPLVDRKITWLRLYKYASQNTTYEYNYLFFYLIKNGKIKDRSISILAYLFEMNSIYKRYVIELLEKRTITRKDFENENQYLRSQGEFEVVDKVNILWQSRNGKTTT